LLSLKIYLLFVSNVKMLLDVIAGWSYHASISGDGMLNIRRDFA